MLDRLPREDLCSDDTRNFHWQTSGAGHRPAADGEELSEDVVGASQVQALGGDPGVVEVGVGVAVARVAQEGDDAAGAALG